MGPRAIVLEVEASLGLLQASRLAILQLQTVVDGGYAVQANGSLLALEMITFLRRNTLAETPAAHETFPELRSIIRANMENEEN